MFNFFDSVAEGIAIIVNFVVSAITNLISMVAMIFKGFIAVSAAIVFLPGFLQAFVITILCYCVIINVINKGG